MSSTHVNHDCTIEFIRNILEKYSNDIIKYFDKNYKFLHMSLFKINDLFFLKPDLLNENLIHTDKTINLILHRIEYIIFNITCDFFYVKNKKFKIDKSSTVLNEMVENWSNVVVYNYDIGYGTDILYHDLLYYVDINTPPHLFDTSSNKNISNLIAKSSINFKTNIITPVTIASHKLSHILYYKNNNITDNIIIEKNEKLHYSGVDELLFELENVSLMNEHKKKVTTGGFIISYNDSDYILSTHIYQKIRDMLPKYNNINKCYIELYKNDNLSFIINFMSLYPSDIIKRINTTIKTLSREFLNIYHITRKKSNTELYNILSNNYKMILFDLHNIFIYTRKKDESIKSLNNIMNSDDEFCEKKSLNHDIIYKYMKKIKTEQICNILVDRLDLLNLIDKITIDINNTRMNATEFKVLFSDCIQTKIMGHLLKNLFIC